MTLKTIKARIAIGFFVLSLLAFLLSLGLMFLLRPFGLPGALAASILLFSAVVYASAYIAAAIELWPFRRLAEGGSKGVWQDALSGEALPAEVREVEDVMLTLKAGMDEAVLSQKRFLADASHEMRSPITIMKGDIEIALRRERDALEYKRVLESSLEEIDRLEFLVKDLMFLARADASELAMNMGVVRLDEALVEVTGRLAPLALSKGVLMTLECGDDGEFLTVGDFDRLRQLFTNIVENALRYTPGGGEVRVRLGRVAGVNKIVVSDTGIGIPEAELPKIFERFYRVDKARARHSGGSGLGLCICRWIVDAHRGEIIVESREGVGTSFTVMLLAQ